MPVDADTRMFRIEGTTALTTEGSTNRLARWSIDPNTNIMSIWAGVTGGWNTSGNKEVRLTGSYPAEPQE
jgi:hypothetical protein